MAKRAALLSGSTPIFWWAKTIGALWLASAMVVKFFRGGKNPAVEGNPFDLKRPIVYKSTSPIIEAPLMPMGLGVDFIGLAPKGLGNCECE